jgi:type II secretory pathway pseudopilin PulG
MNIKQNIIFKYMSKKRIIAIMLVVILIAGVGFWAWKNQQKKEVVQNQNEQQQSVQQQQTSESDQQQNQGEKQKFVTDVDPNIGHWQTKEAEFFTIKFPKEWFWLESVIANNPDFDTVKYADIGVGTGGNYPITLANNTEVVISFNGSATSDAGTPQDRIDSIFKLTKQNDPLVRCSIYNNKTIPFAVYCSSAHDSQLQQSYYVINKEVSITFTARTTKDTLVKKEILDKIADSIILK